jgi:hypothetical protein
LAWDVRRLPELVEFSPYIASAALRQATVGRCRAALKERIPALRGCAVRPFTAIAMATTCWSMRGKRDQRHSGFRRHDPRAARFEPAVAMSELLTDELVAPLGAAARAARLRQQHQRWIAAEVEVLYDIIAARHALVTLWCMPGAAARRRRGADPRPAGDAQAARSLDRL